jgi:hyperosmotically inducible protein
MRMAKPSLKAMARMYANAQNSDFGAAASEISARTYARQRTDPPARRSDDRCSSHHAENGIVRFDRKLFVLGGALAGALCVQLAGCSNQDGQTSPAASASLGTVIDDTVITAKVKSALLAEPDVRSFDLKVETRKGQVQLSGFVDSQAQINRAVTTARGVAGVTSIEHSMTLKGANATIGNTLDDGIITTRVKSALLADPNVRSFDIAVVTRVGAVQLSGYVDSQTGIDQAIALVRKVEGVTSVDNVMSVKR